MIDFSDENLDDMDFSGVTLDGSDFSRTTLTNNKFVNGSYRSCLFEDIKFPAFEDATISSSNFSGSTFKNVDGMSVSFMSSTLNNVSFSEGDHEIALWGCTSSKLNLTEMLAPLSIDGGLINSLKLKDCIVDFSEFEKARVTMELKSTQATVCQLISCPLFYIYADDASNISQMKILHSEGTIRVDPQTACNALDVTGGTIHINSGNTLKNFKFRGGCWIKFYDPTRNFDSGSFGAGNFYFLNNTTSITDSNFKRSDLLGDTGRQEFSGTSTTFEGVTFAKFTFKNSQFFQCTFKNVTFYQCDLGNTSFVGCHLNNVDFRTSNTRGISLHQTQKNGVKGL